MAHQRKYPRYEVSTSAALLGRIENQALPLRLFTFGQGGCSFLGRDPEVSLVPPQKLRVSIECQTKPGSRISEIVEGTLIYVRPWNATQETMFGIQFESSQLPQMAPIAGELEGLCRRGLVDRA